MNTRILLQQLLVSGLAALHRREACNPQLDNVGLAVEIFNQLAEGFIGQRGIILLGNGDAWDLAANVGIKGRHRDTCRSDALDQIGGIGRAALRKNDAVILLADGLVNEVLKTRVITVAQEGIHLETELAPLLDCSGQKLGGVVIGTQITDHRDADLPLMLGNSVRNGGKRGFSGQQGQAGQQAEGEQ